MLNKQTQILLQIALFSGLVLLGKQFSYAETLPKYQINNNVSYDLTYSNIFDKQPQIAAAEGELVTNPKPTQKPSSVKLAAAVEQIEASKIEAPTPAPVIKTPAPIVLASNSAPHEVIEKIVQFSTEFGVDTNMMIEIARCESGFRPDAINGPYAGIFQFNISTWQSNRAAMGQDTNPDLRYNPEEAAKTAAFKMSRDGFGAWPACSRKALTLLK